MRARMFVLAAVLFASCATDSWVSDRLYFGQTLPGGGGVVTEEQWTGFVRDVVTPRFPAGFTTYAANGQWREADGTIAREPVMVIEILHRPSEESDRAIAEIMRTYRERFHQEAVLRVRDRQRVTFEQ